MSPCSTLPHGVRRLLMCAALCLPLAAPAQQRFDLASTPTRLPKTVLPSKVQLTLDLDPAQPTFAGTVAITLRALQPVPAIMLNAKALDADSAELAATTAAAGAAARVLQVQPDTAAQTWRLLPADGQPIAAGEYVLTIRYRGRVQIGGEGLYRADFRVQGQPAQMLATQLEATEARSVLPVFDEPVFRTVFQLEVKAPQGLQVLSNTPLLGTVDEGTSTRHRFAPTPAMPSYLLAVTVGRFDVLEGSSGRLPLRIFTAPGKREQARFAMQATQQVLPYFADYFGRPFALPKLDQIAVPSTRQGAMEDWGFISYTENGLLFDPARSSDGTQRRIFSVIAHEVAHQWFGNLVSVASWSEIWLNEAFATWMQRKASARFHPEWQTELRERRDLDWTMARDATPATRAIRSGPVSEASVFEVFDGITYDKGGAVLSMLEQWLGPAAFQRGLAAYMAERGMQPATAGDLWFHIGAAASQPVAAVAASWTDQPGLPVVSVSQRCDSAAGSDRSGDTTVVTLRQSRFSTSEALAGGPWQIPLRLVRGSQQRTVLMTGPELQVQLPGCNQQPLLANAGGHGYYRVDYDAASRARVVAAFAQLTPADRVAMLSDSYALASAGRLPVADHIALLRAVAQVQDASRAALFGMAESQWQNLDTALDGTPAQAPLRAAGQALFAPELARLGWQPAAREDSETQALRAGLIERLARFGHAPTLVEAHGRFTAALAGGAGVQPSLRAAVLFAVGSDASDAEFDALLAALRSSESQEERRLLVAALSAGTNTAHAQRLLDESLSGRLAPDIARSLPNAVASVPALSQRAYGFVLAHWDALLKLTGDGVFGGRYWLLPGAVYLSSDPAVAQQMLTDQQRLNGGPGASTAQQVAAAIDNRHRLRDREAGPLAAALAAPTAR